MTLWMVRAGKMGEREDFALDNKQVVVGSDLDDYTTLSSKDDLLDLMRRTYPNEGDNTLKNWTNQSWAFKDTIKDGDLVALPLKKRSVIAFGEITGDYAFLPSNPGGARHTRPVRWLKEVPRNAIDQDLLYSFGAFLTVCRISRNDAENRIRKILGLATEAASASAVEEFTEIPEEYQAPQDLEVGAKDEIRQFLGRKLKGHALARLVGELLEAQGYKTEVSPEGPDGGVDIIAGKGAMGFDPPRICVQVKSGEETVGEPVFRDLMGTVQKFGADHGILVSWGGFTKKVYEEARRNFFFIRLWDADDVVSQIQAQYPNLPDTTQAELPLKRIWVLVREDGEG